MTFSKASFFDGLKFWAGPLIFVFIFVAVLKCCSKPEQEVSYQPIGGNGLSEVEAYKMLYDDQVKSNDAILQTIYYALGGLATAVLLVFASNWWFNEKKVLDISRGINDKINIAKNESINDVREKFSSLTADLLTKINDSQVKYQDEITAALSNIFSKFTDFTDKTRDEIKDDINLYSNNFQIQLRNLDESYRQQLSALREIVNSQNDYLKGKIDGTESGLKRLISDKINRIEQKLARNSFYMWKFRGVLENALMSLITELELKIKIGSKNTTLSLCLNNISETIEEMPDMSQELKDRTVEALENVPEIYDNIKDDILKILEKIKISED